MRSLFPHRDRRPPSAGKSSQRPPETVGTASPVDVRPMASEDRGQRSFGLLGAPKMPKVGERRPRLKTRASSAPSSTTLKSRLHPPANMQRLSFSGLFLSGGGYWPVFNPLWPDLNSAAAYFEYCALGVAWTLIASIR